MIYFYHMISHTPQRLQGTGRLEIRRYPPYASVRYRGHSFYIDDGDLSSKSTFSMLNLVLALQAGEIPSGAPILTLPVSQ